MEGHKMDKKDYLQIAVFAFVCAIVFALSISVTVRADELPEADQTESVPDDDNFNVVEIPAQIDYSGNFDALNENIVMLQEQLETLQETLANMADSVSGNDIDTVDYTEQLQAVSDKLDDIKDVVTVSENTVSENSLFSTPLNDFTTDQQLSIFVTVLMFIVLVAFIAACFF